MTIDLYQHHFPAGVSIPRLMERGASYQRQRAVAAAHAGALEPVVDALLTEMRDGLSL